MSFKTDLGDCTLDAKGGTGGSAWIRVMPPYSDDESDREWGRLVRTRNGVDTVVASGTTSDPIDGQPVTDTVGANGTCSYVIQAKYTGSATIYTSANPLTVTLP